MYIPLSLLEASDLHQLLGGYGSNPAPYTASSRLPFGNNQTWTNPDGNLGNIFILVTIFREIDTRILGVKIRNMKMDFNTGGT